VSASAPSAALRRAGGAGTVVADDALLRANPAYELVPFERLSTSEQALIEAPEDDLYGLLRPSGTQALAPRSATLDLALLFLTLRDPGPLPAFAAQRLGSAADETISRLVLDGVLEVKRGDAFVSGPAALAGSPRPPSAGSRVGELSVAALRHGQGLVGLPPQLLALRLYMFGRRPLTPALRARLPDEVAVGRFLGIGDPNLRTSWIESGTGAGDPWRMWRRRRQRPQTDGPGRFKLYVAPTLDALPDAFAAVAETFAELPSCAGFKVARTVDGLCRPDKLVAYFARLEHLHSAAAQLRPSLQGLSAQPVPFTGHVDGEGVLSWGVDPGADQTGGRSWRLWLAGRLASYLVEGAVGADDAIEPWQFALERIRIDGIDVDSWAPTSTAWDGTR
jgi:hypothetical protein